MTIQVTKDRVQEKYSWKPMGSDNSHAVQVPGRRKLFDWLVGRSGELSEDRTGQVSVQVSFEKVSGTFAGAALDGSGYKSVKWTPSDTPCLYSYIAYVVNRLTGEVATTYAHAGPSGRSFHDDGDKDPGITEVPEPLKKFVNSNQNYILIFLWSSVVDEYTSYRTNLLAPSGPFMDFLHLCGAGPSWHSWVDTLFYDIQGPGPYALVGVIGSGMGGGIEKRVDVTVKSPPLREVPENPSVSLTVPLKYTDKGWTPTAS